MAEEFLEAWRQRVNYELGEGKAVVEETSDVGGYRIIEFIGDMDNSLNGTANSTKTHDKREQPADASHFVTMSNETLLYVGQFLDGKMHGNGVLIRPWCEGKSLLKSNSDILLHI